MQVKVSTCQSEDYRDVIFEIHSHKRVGHVNFGTPSPRPCPNRAAESLLFVSARLAAEKAVCVRVADDRKRILAR